MLLTRAWLSRLWRKHMTSQLFKLELQKPAVCSRDKCEPNTRQLELRFGFIFSWKCVFVLLNSIAFPKAYCDNGKVSWIIEISKETSVVLKQCLNKYRSCASNPESVTCIGIEVVSASFAFSAAKFSSPVRSHIKKGRLRKTDRTWVFGGKLRNIPMCPSYCTLICKRGHGRTHRTYLKTRLGNNAYF